MDLASHRSAGPREDIGGGGPAEGQLASPPLDLLVGHTRTQTSSRLVKNKIRLFNCKKNKVSKSSLIFYDNFNFLLCCFI